MNPSKETYFCTGFISAGIYKVRSSGDWYPTRLNATNILDIAVRPESSNTVVAAIEGYRRLAISTDGGSSWGELVNSPTNRSAVTYDPQNPDRLYAGFGWEDRSSTTYRLDMSTDGGLNWASTGPMFYVSGNISMGVTDIWIHPDNAQKIIVTVGSPYGGVYLSNNGGTTWADHPLEFWASSIVSDPNDPDRLFYGTFHQGYVCYSENGGYLWTDISPGVDTFWEVRDIVVGADAIAYAATDVGLWTWDGFSWAKINGLPSDDMTTLVIGRSSDSEILYVGTGDSGVFVSDNGGSSWDEFNSGLGNMSINRLSISDTSPKRLYAGTSHGSVWQYDFSVDACEGDFDKDGDIDGKDLSAFISDNKGILLLEFSSKFGGTQCD